MVVDKVQKKKAVILVLGILPGLLMVITFATPVYARTLSTIPGLWLGHIALAGMEWILGFGILGLMGLALIEKRHSKIAAVYSLILMVFTFGVLMGTRGSREESSGIYRAERELPRYKQVVSMGGRFGDQYTEKHGTRTLHYWRWASWYIDNAVGVIYDSEDKLHEDEKGLFRYPSNGGAIWKLRKIEPHWYLVEHS